MSISLPPEIFDLIVEWISEEQATLKVCCILSKSWVARTRRHLFAVVEFTNRSLVESWMNAFPDPSNSPAHHTRDLRILDDSGFIAATTGAYAWIRNFCNIVCLTAEMTLIWNYSQISLVPLHALSSTLKSLCFVDDYIPFPEVLDLICSFPSLEDLSLIFLGGGETGTSVLPSMSPKFTGSLYLVMEGGIRSSISQFLALPGGLHFTNIWVHCLTEDFESTTGLVSACCNTLEVLTITHHFLGTSSISAPLDLSKATNLKKVMFEIGRPSVRWVLTALQTVKSKNLQQITIHQDTWLHETTDVEEGLFPEWQDLDHLLVRFWTSHSIRPKLVDQTKHLKDLTPTLFPELTRRGLLDIV